MNVLQGQLDDMTNAFEAEKAAAQEAKQIVAAQCAHTLSCHTLSCHTRPCLGKVETHNGVWVLQVLFGVGPWPFGTALTHRFCNYVGMKSHANKKRPQNVNEKSCKPCSRHFSMSARFDARDTL
jgi:hypothetical protein